MRHLTHLGMVNEIKPKKRQYDYALLLGATAPRMQQQLNYLAQLWRNGIHFNVLVFLVGQRPLTNENETDNINTLVKQVAGSSASSSARSLTETEAAKLLWLSADLPKAMRNIDTAFIDTPRIWQQNQWQRPNTRDTVKLTSAPSPGCVLALPNQPHSAYQQAVTKQILSADMAAPSASEHTPMAVYLDALALWLHNQPVIAAFTVP